MEGSHVMAYQVDKQSYRGQVRSSLTRDQGAQASSEECPEHVGEREQQERTAAKSVDCPHSREGEDEIDQAEAEGRIKRLCVRVTGPGEDS